MSVESLEKFDFYPEGLLPLTFYRNDPVTFCNDTLGAYPYRHQQEILDSIVNYKKTYVSTCFNSGFTTLAGWAALWFMATREDALVLVIAPTQRQLEDIFYRQIRYSLDKAVELGSPLKYKLSGRLGVEFKGNRISFRSPQNITSLYGVYAKEILWIIDDAAAIKDSVWAVVEHHLSSYKESTLLAGGSPRDTDPPFSYKFRSQDVNPFTIGAYDTPNFKGITERDLVDNKTPFPSAWGDVNNLITQQVVLDTIRDYGVRSNIYRSRVLGKFPLPDSQEKVVGNQ